MDPTNWLPFLADPPQRVRPIREAATWTEPFRDAYTKPPDILATLTFFPVLPPPSPRPPRAREEITVVEPFEGPTRLYPGVWRPVLAGPLPRPPRAQQERVTIDPTFGAALVTAAGMSWAPHLPDMPRPARISTAPGSYTTEVSLIAAAVPCVDLVDTSFARTDLMTDTVTETDLASEALTSPTFLGETLC